MASNDRAQPLRHRWYQCIRADPRMTGSTLFVLLVAATYGNSDGTNVRVGVRRLADDTGMSERTVRYGLAEGVNSGYLFRERRGGRRGDGVGMPAEYRLTLPFPVDNPFSTGNGLPLENGLNRQYEASQPANGDTSTGNGLPPTSSDHRYDQKPRPAAWCGRCDETTRLIEDEDTRVPRRCEVCHPLRKTTA
jgi:hypothetical protein